MVKYDVDAAAHAIASAPRRAIVDRLTAGPASMSELADTLGVTLPAVDKHLKALVAGGLVTKGKRGRTTVVELRPGGLDELATWAMSTRLMWSSLLGRFEQHLEEQEPEKQEKENP